MKGQANNIDAFLFLLLAVLFLLPLFQEFDFFGLKLKSELSSLKGEIREQILNIRSDINSIRINTQVNPQFILQVPSDSQIPSIETEFNKALQQTLKSYNIRQPRKVQTEFEVPSDIDYLIKARYALEKEVRKLGKSVMEKEDEDRVYPLAFQQIVRSLRKSEIINADLEEVLKQIYAICSKAAHSEHVSEAKIGFVKEIAPDLIATLKAIQRTRERR